MVNTGVTNNPVTPWTQNSGFAFQHNNVNGANYHDLETIMNTLRQPVVASENFRKTEIVSPRLRSQAFLLLIGFLVLWFGHLLS